MPNLSIAPAVESRIFQCPSCKETINTSQSRCPFCSAAVDPQAAEAAADNMKKVNQACSDGSYLRVMAGSMLGFFGLSLVPFLGIVGICGMWFLYVAIPVMTIRWWVKFGSLRSEDSEFRSARKSLVIALGTWLVFMILNFIRR